jgi:nucleoside-diphosphate-sugar epimerase
MGREISVKQDPDRIRPPGSEVMRLLADPTLIREVTDWRPKHDLAEGLRQTSQWFQKAENLAHYKTDIYNV